LEISSQSGIWNALGLVAWFLAFYLYFGLGITLGYHRLLTHKSLQVPRWVMYLIVSGGYLCLMGSPIVWVGVHRLHHQKSDLPGDPHSPQEGFMHALLGWMTKMTDVQTDEELRNQCRDLMRDPLFRALGDSHTPDQALLCLGINILWRAAIWYVFGAGVLAVNLLATLITFFAPQLVNTVCHMPNQGYRSHDTRDGSRNVWWVGLLACGEGWHNNHHAVPTSARHGFAWYEIDVTWYTIWLLEKLGLGTKVIRPPKQAAKIVDPERERDPVAV